MWPFSSSSSKTDPPEAATPPPEAPPAAAAAAGSGIPRRAAREKCWAAKDAYFGCLDDASVLVPGDEGTGKGSPCAELRAAYEVACQKSWVHYFNTRRVLAEEQKEILAAQRAQEAAARRR